ncbi:MAG: tetratricopeptide repeat protein [Fibrobacterota bacterium]
MQEKKATKKTRENNYWDFISNLIDSAISKDKGNIRGFISKYRVLIDFAIAPQQIKSVTSSPYLDPGTLKSMKGLRFFYVSDWISEIIDILTMVDEKKEVLEKLKHLNQALSEIDQKIRDRQQERYNFLVRVIDTDTEDSQHYRRVIMALPRIDDVRYTAIYKNDKAANGVYFNVDNKKIFAGERIWVLKQDRRIEEMMRRIEDRRDRLTARKHFEIISALLIDKLRIERAVDRLRKKLMDISLEVDSISSEMLSATVQGNIRRLMGLFEREVELSGGSVGFFYNFDENFVSLKKIYAIYRQILEFIQHAFDNKYVIKMGAPRILVIPGNGNGFYDFRENYFVLPLSPVSDIETSIAYSISSYMRHYDYSNTLINDFNALFSNEAKLKSHKAVERFNSYLVKWLFSEYKGFRVFDKDVRRFFQKYFAPPKDAVFVPLPLLKGVQSPQDENFFIKNIKVDVNLGDPSMENLWYISILEYRRGRLKKSRNYLKKLVKNTSDYIFAYYNLAVISLQLNEKSAARRNFETFLSFNHQCWWTIQGRKYLDTVQAKKQTGQKNGQTSSNKD